MDVQELYESGYRQGRPYWGMIDGASIDEGACIGLTCENCGHKGMNYKPFIKDETHSYRAFAVCPNCGASFEF